MKKAPWDMEIEQWIIYHKSTIYRRCNKFWNKRGMIDLDNVCPMDFFFKYGAHFSLDGASNEEQDSQDL